MYDAIFSFYTQFGYSLHCARGQEKRKVNTDGSSRQCVCKQCPSLCFSFGVMAFLWVYDFPLCLWFSFGFMSFLIMIFNVLSGLGIRLNWMKEERCAMHKEPGRSSGGKICFLLPAALALACGSRREAYGDPESIVLD